MMNRRFLTATLLAALIALPLAAQNPGPGGPGNGGPVGPGGPGGGPGGAPPDAVLKSALGFTDEQATQLRALLETRRTTVEPLIQQLRAAEKAVGDLLAQTSPDPTALGSAVLAVRGIQKQMAAADATFRQGFDALLTSDQTAKVAAIKALQDQLAAGQALRSLGL